MSCPSIRRTSGFFVGLMLTYRLTVLAQASPVIPLGDPIYHDVDRLLNAGLADDAIVGQRPYSRRLVARIADSARARLEARGDYVAADLRALVLATIQRITERTDIDRLRSPTFDYSRWLALHSAQVEFLKTDAQARAISGNGLGTVEADVNPLTANRDGRVDVAGNNVSLETEHWVAMPGGLTLQLQPRVHLADEQRSGDRRFDGRILSGSARLVEGNVALSAGREYTQWSPEADGGLFFSQNAPALNMLRLTTDAPAHLPGPLHRLGILAGTLQFADLGASEQNSGSKVVAYKVTAKPSAALEIGASFLNHFGGVGAKNPSLGRRVIDLLPFVDIFRHHADSTEFDSDKLLGGDGRIRIERLFGVVLFGEVALEDFDLHRLRSVFTEDAAYHFGIIVPALGSPGVSLRVGGRTTGIRFYEHHAVQDGLAASRFVLGDALGRDAAGAYGGLEWVRSPSVVFTADAAVERRGNNQYEGTYQNPDRTGLVFRVVAPGVDERRSRFAVGGQRNVAHGDVVTRVVAGAEHTTNYGNQRGDRQTHGLASVTISVYR